MIEAAFTRIHIWLKILITSNFMIILLLTISPTNNCDICYLRCPLVDITWLPSSYRTSVIHCMQAAKQLFDAVKSNDVPTVRKFLDLGTDVDLAYVRYQTILFHPFLLYSDSPPVHTIPVCLSTSFIPALSLSSSSTVYLSNQTPALLVLHRFLPLFSLYVSVAGCISFTVLFPLIYSAPTLFLVSLISLGL